MLENEEDGREREELVEREEEEVEVENKGDGKTTITLV